MHNKHFGHLFAVFQALLVTFLWSTSFIIIKWGLAEIPALTFAGMRYFLAFLFFIPFMVRKKYAAEIKSLTFIQWKKLILLGLVFYTFTQGTQFLGLSLLPAVSVSLMLNFTPIIVALMGLAYLHEKPNFKQWFGVFMFLAGIIYYFYPISFRGNQGIGLAIMAIGVLANSGASVLGREINRNQLISPAIITFISMGVGAVILLAIGITLNGLPALSIKYWLILIWLAAINTAFAFTLWNFTLRTLSALESSIINGTMLIQISILAWFFLDEKFSFTEGTGLIIAAAGIILVQLKSRKII